MFESPDLYMDDLLGILAIEKIRYDHTGFIAGESLYGDDFPVVCYDALGNVADSISADVDDCDTYIQKFCFPGMRNFTAFAGNTAGETAFLSRTIHMSGKRPIL